MVKYGRRLKYIKQKYSFTYRCLEEGIDKYGVGKWAKILKDPSLAFQEGRTYVDLKDKWRNYAEYVHYSAHSKYYLQLFYNYFKFGRNASIYCYQ